MARYNICSHEITPDIIEHSRVFISHRLTDKPFAREIARYFEFLGVYHYFDEKDLTLQKAIQEGHSNDRAIVESIDEGLAHSTHLLAVLSARTMGSWWVPYEIGSSRARNAKIAYLMLPSLTPQMLPEYIRICTNLWTPEEVFDWVKDFTQWPDRVFARFYSEWQEMEGGGPFAELGPGEEAFDEWRAKAEIENSTYLEWLRKLMEQDSIS